MILVNVTFGAKHFERAPFGCVQNDEGAAQWDWSGTFALHSNYVGKECLNVTDSLIRMFFLPITPLLRAK